MHLLAILSHMLVQLFQHRVSRPVIWSHESCGTTMHMFAAISLGEWSDRNWMSPSWLKKGSSYLTSWTPCASDSTVKFEARGRAGVYPACIPVHLWVNSHFELMLVKKAVGKYWKMHALPHKRTCLHAYVPPCGFIPDKSLLTFRS